MLTIATFYSRDYIRLMKVIVAIFIVISGHAFAQSYESLTVNLRDAAGPDLGAYQANVRGYEWTVKNGSAAVNLTGNAPFMYWYQEPLSASVVTARITVVSATAGIFRAVFLPSDLNPSFMSNLTSGATNLRYGVGVDYSDGPESVKHGRFRLLSDPFSAGSVGTTFFSTNVNWALINWTGLPSYLLDAPTDGGIYARKDAAWYSIAGYATGGQWAADISAALVGVATGTPVYEVSGIGTDATARAWAQAGSNKAATAYGWGNHASAGYATGSPIYSLTGYATGTPVYAESDPLFVASSNAILTKAQAALLYATGTPIYAVSGLGTDTTARAWALGASNRADAAYVLAANAATGTPIYSVAGLATGTPIYSVAGLATGTPIYSVAGLATGTPIYSVAGLATGTPIYVENNPSLAPLSNGLASAHGVGSNALAVANAASNLAAGAAGWGNHATNGYAVQGGNITGRWFALNATYSGSSYQFVGGGEGNSVNGRWDFVGGGKTNSASGGYSSVVGGRANAANGSLSFVGGGHDNTAHGLASSILGGQLNTVDGNSSVVAGGFNNKALGVFSFAAGTGANATNDGSFVFSSQDNAYNLFGSRGDNTFNVRSVGGVYFLSTDFWIQDTNGNTIARFSATNTTISGNLNLTGYATTSDVLTVGVRATNAQITASNAATTASAATNLAIGIGAGATNGLNAIGLVATNGQITASNALAAALGVGVVVSNQTPSAWSQIATNHANMSNYAITNVDYIAFGTNTIDGTETNAIGIYNGHPSWVKAPGSVRTFASSDNLSSLGIQTTSGFNSSITNYARITPTGYSFPTSWNDSVGNNGDLVRSGTNAAFKSAGVWSRWTVVTNW